MTLDIFLQPEERNLQNQIYHQISVNAKRTSVDLAVYVGKQEFNVQKQCRCDGDPTQYNLTAENLNMHDYLMQ